MRWADAPETIQLLSVEACSPVQGEYIDTVRELRRRFRRLLQQHDVSAHINQAFPAFSATGDIPREDLHDTRAVVI